MAAQGEKISLTGPKELVRFRKARGKSSADARSRVSVPLEDARSVPPGRASMYFQVLGSYKADNGKTRIFLETDDPSLKTIMHLMEHVAEFAHILNYKFNAYEKAQELKKVNPVDLMARQLLWKDVLDRYREMRKRGVSPSKCRTAIAAELRAEGRKATYSDVDTWISIATKEERENKVSRKALAGLTVERSQDQAAIAAGSRRGSVPRVRLVSSRLEGITSEKPIKDETEAAT